MTKNVFFTKYKHVIVLPFYPTELNFITYSFENSKCELMFEYLFISILMRRLKGHVIYWL